MNKPTQPSKLVHRDQDLLVVNYRIRIYFLNNPTHPSYLFHRDHELMVVVFFTTVNVGVKCFSLRVTTHCYKVRRVVKGKPFPGKSTLNIITQEESRRNELLPVSI